MNRFLFDFSCCVFFFVLKHCSFILLGFFGKLSAETSCFVSKRKFIPPDGVFDFFFRGVKIYALLYIWQMFDFNKANFAKNTQNSQDTSRI